MKHPKRILSGILSGFSIWPFLSLAGWERSEVEGPSVERNSSSVCYQRNQMSCNVSRKVDRHPPGLWRTTHKPLAIHSGSRHLEKQTHQQCHWDKRSEEMICTGKHVPVKRGLTGGSKHTQPPQSGESTCVELCFAWEQRSCVSWWKCSFFCLWVLTKRAFKAFWSWIQNVREPEDTENRAQTLRDAHHGFLSNKHTVRFLIGRDVCQPPNVTPLMLEMHLRSGVKRSWHKCYNVTVL